MSSLHEDGRLRGLLQQLGPTPLGARTDRPKSKPKDERRPDKPKRSARTRDKSETERDTYYYNEYQKYLDNPVAQAHDRASYDSMFDLTRPYVEPWVDSVHNRTTTKREAAAADAALLRAAERACEDELTRIELQGTKEKEGALERLRAAEARYG